MPEPEWNYAQRPGQRAFGAISGGASKTNAEDCTVSLQTKNAIALLQRVSRVFGCMFRVLVVSAGRFLYLAIGAFFSSTRKHLMVAWVQRSNWTNECYSHFAINGAPLPPHENTSSWMPSCVRGSRARNVLGASKVSASRVYDIETLLSRRVERHTASQRAKQPNELWQRRQLCAVTWTTARGPLM